MKPSSLLACAGPVLAAPAPRIEPVPLPAPHNWLADGAQMTPRIMSGYHAPAENYTRETWGQYVLDRCLDAQHCTSLTAVFYNNTAANNVAWFGYIFSGPHTTPVNYKRVADVEHSIPINVLRPRQA